MSVEMQANPKVAKSNLFKVPSDLIVVDQNFNLRFSYNENKMRELKESIDYHGVLNDVKGYKSGQYYYVIDGHRRVMAAQQLVREKRQIDPDFELRIPMTTQNVGESEQTIHMILYNEGEAFTPLELAMGIRRLENYGLEVDEIAEKLNKTKSYIQRLLKFAKNVSPRVKKAVVNNEMESTTGMNLVEKCVTETAQNQELDRIRAEINDSEKPSENSGKKKTKITNKKVSKKQNLSETIKKIEKEESDVIDPFKLDLLRSAIKFQKGEISEDDLRQMLS